MKSSYITEGDRLEMVDVKSEQVVDIKSEPVISESKPMTTGKKREYKLLSESEDIPNEEKIKVNIDTILFVYLSLNYCVTSF